jgi:hypothetical protein
VSLNNADKHRLNLKCRISSNIRSLALQCRKPKESSTLCWFSFQCRNILMSNISLDNIFSRFILKCWAFSDVDHSQTSNIFKSRTLSNIEHFQKSTIIKCRTKNVLFNVEKFEVSFKTSRMSNVKYFSRSNFSFSRKKNHQEISNKCCKLQKKMLTNTSQRNDDSARRLMGSRIIESAAYCNQILLARLYIDRAQNTSVNWMIRLLLSLLCWPKVILLSGGHCTFNLRYSFVNGILFVCLTLSLLVNSDWSCFVLWAL